MPINALTRVMWRLRNYNKTKITIPELKRAIIKECGYSEQTYYRVKKSIITLGWLKTKKTSFIITGKDLEET